MGTQCQRLGILGVELTYDLSPEHTCCTHLGNLHEEVHSDSPEEAQAGCEGIDIHTGVDTCAEVFQTVGQCVCKLDIACGAGFLHVVTRNGDGVELRHILRCIFEYVGDDPHRELGGINVGVAHHEFLEDIVLDGTGHLFKLGALFQTGVDVEGEHGEHSAVHGHRHRHLVQRNTVEEHLHVLNGAD